MTPREQLIATLDELTEAQIEAILSYAQALQLPELSAEYDPDNDPMIGFITDEVDFDARDVKRILYDEITERSGWTQKPD